MKLELTTNILDVNNIFYNNTLKYYYKIINNDILLQILCDEYQYLTCNLYSSFFRSYVENYTIPFKSKYKNLLIKDNNIFINDYILLPVGKYYKFGINSAFYYFYLNIIKELPENTDVVIVQVIGPWEINNGNLHLFFELENLLMKEKNCKVKTIFLLISFGEKIEYTNIIIENNEKKDFIIIDCNDYKNFEKIKPYIKESSNIIVDPISFYEYKTCYYEIATLPLLLLLYNNLLKCLKIGGNFYLNIKTFLIYKPTFQFLYTISTFFNNFEILLNDIVFSHFGMLMFSNYKNNIDNTFASVIKDYINKDKFLGQHFVPMNKTNLSNCKSLDKNINIPNTHYLIKSISTTIIIDNNFISKFIRAYKKYNEQLKKSYKKMVYVKQILDTGNNYKIKKNIDTILINNISKSIDYCKNKNIEINDIFLNMKIPNYHKIISYYFPRKTGLNYRKLQIAIDSPFSISAIEDLKRLSNLIITNTPGIKYIIDGNSNIGIGSIIFSSYFKFVFSVEYDKTTYQKLKNNINVYDLKNVKVINDDIIKFMKEFRYQSNINEYCIFLDPPWSGYFYKIDRIIDLYLNNINILHLIKEMNIHYIYIKVPYNYNFSELFNLFSNVIIYKFNSYYIIFIYKN